MPEWRRALLGEQAEPGAHQPALWLHVGGLTSAARDYAVFVIVLAIATLAGLAASGSCPY